MRQGLAEYRAKTKTNWRGWQWNRIVERLSVDPRKALALYLCGPEDLDRSKALAKGFRNENLIAVDLDKGSIESVRRAGGLGICHDLVDLVHAWPVNWPLHVIVADFCGGLNEKSVPLIPALMFGSATSRPREDEEWVVCSVNLQRGRDRFSESMRKFSTDFFQGDPQLGKHRGQIFSCEALCQGACARIPEDAATPHEIKIVAGVSIFGAAAINSYSSTKHTYFDTAVFRWPGVLPVRGRSGLNLLEENKWWEDEPRVRAKGIAEARRKIAACRAIRTAKLRAK